jgi:hypothetical protein
MQRTRRLLGGLCLAVLFTAAARADEPPRWHKCRLREWPGKQPIGPGTQVQTYEGAGYPNELSKYAVPSNGPNYEGYYVGGNTPWAKGGARDRRDDEGTWGWDYSGWCHFRFKVNLFWNDEKYQGGYGAYKIDGPPVKDVGPLIAEIKEQPPLSRQIHKHHGHE